MSWPFDSGNASQADDGKETRGRAPDAATAKTGYIYQGDLRDVWATDLWMYQYPVDSWIQRASLEGEMGERRVGGGTADMISAITWDGAMYSMPGVNTRAGVRIVVYKPDFWVVAIGPPHTQPAYGWQTYKDKLYVYVQGDKVKDGAYMYRTSEGEEWKLQQRFPNLPIRLEFVTAFIGKKGYTYAGLIDQGGPPAVSTDRLREYDAIERGPLKILRSLPETLHGGSGGAIDGWVFHISGVRGNKVIDRVYAYRPEENSWKQWRKQPKKQFPDNMPGARSHAATFMLPECNHSIFTTGGSLEQENQTLVTDTNFRFNVKEDVWTTMKTPLPSAIPEKSGARFRHGAFTL